MRKHHPGEKSFTLLETIIALGLLVTILLEFAGVQGNAVKFSNYERKSTQAIWIAKAIMSEVEYKWKYYELKDVKVSEIKEKPVDEALCPKDPTFGCDYTYSLNIDLWKLPLIDLLLGGLGGGSSDDEKGGDGGANPMIAMIKDQVKQILGDELLKVASVEVFWPEGSKQNSVELAYLLTGQQRLDQQIDMLQSPSAGTGTDTMPVMGLGTSTDTAIDAGNLPPNQPGLGPNPEVSQ